MMIRMTERKMGKTTGSRKERKGKVSKSLEVEESRAVERNDGPPNGRAPLPLYFFLPPPSIFNNSFYYQ